MASEASICNRALQKLGAERITSLLEDSPNAQECNASYSELRDFELSSHRWNFAIERVALAADATAPAWGRANSFTLPADYLRILPPYPEDNVQYRDWQIEQGKILTDDTAPLNVRYVKRVTDPNLMTPSFREALSALIAVELSERLTQSNTKKAALRSWYEEIIAKAKKNNSIQNPAFIFPEGTWLTGRQ